MISHECVMPGQEPRIRAGNGSPSKITTMAGRGKTNRGHSILQGIRETSRLRTAFARPRDSRERGEAALLKSRLRAGRAIKGWGKWLGNHRIMQNPRAGI